MHVRSFYSVGDLARLAGVSRKVIARWIDLGVLSPVERVGRRRWVPIDTVRNAIPELFASIVERGALLDDAAFGERRHVSSLTTERIA